MSANHPQPSAPNVLVVEDDASTRKLYQYVLALDGYHMTPAITGQDALVQATAQPIDAIILDYHLPDIDGIQACRQLRAIVAAIVPILVITADQDPTLEADTRAAGAACFLVKPFNPTDLLGWLRDLMPPRERTVEPTTGT